MSYLAWETTIAPMILSGGRVLFAACHLTHQSQNEYVLARIGEGRLFYDGSYLSILELGHAMLLSLVVAQPGHKTTLHGGCQENQPVLPVRIFSVYKSRYVGCTHSLAESTQ